MKKCEEKQIEEMARVIGRNRMACDNGDCKKCNSHEQCLYQDIACGLYREDYRKQSVGEWKTEDTMLGKCCTCSVCGGCPTMEYRYCPYCGAKMKGGAE